MTYHPDTVREVGALLEGVSLTPAECRGLRLLTGRFYRADLLRLMYATAATSFIRKLTDCGLLSCAPVATSHGTRGRPPRAYTVHHLDPDAGRIAAALLSGAEVPTDAPAEAFGAWEWTTRLTDADGTSYTEDFETREEAVHAALFPVTTFGEPGYSAVRGDVLDGAGDVVWAEHYDPIL